MDETTKERKDEPQTWKSQVNLDGFYQRELITQGQTSLAKERRHPQMAKGGSSERWKNLSRSPLV
jgi:hypothetical protein